MRIRNILLALFIILLPMSRCAAYIYDGGIPQHLGVQLKDNTSCEWVAEPFILTDDCYATALGAAVGRGYGPTDAGFNVSIVTIVNGEPDKTICELSQPLVPLNTQYVYYDGSLPSPVFLNAGVFYALVLKPSSTDFLGSLSWGVVPGTYYGKGTGDYGSTWFTLSYPLAVRIDGYVIPEPTSIAVLVVGLVGTFTLRRRYS